MGPPASGDRPPMRRGGRGRWIANRLESALRESRFGTAFPVAENRIRSFGPDGGVIAS